MDLKRCQNVQFDVYPNAAQKVEAILISFKHILHHQDTYLVWSKFLSVMQEMPHNDEFPTKDMITMEAQSKDHTMTLLFIPHQYLEPPATFGEPILGPGEE